MKMNIIYPTTPKKQFNEIPIYTCFIHQSTLYFKIGDYYLHTENKINAVCLDDEFNCMSSNPLDNFQDTTLVIPVDVDIKINYEVD